MLTCQHVFLKIYHFMFRGVDCGMLKTFFFFISYRVFILEIHNIKDEIEVISHCNCNTTCSQRTMEEGSLPIFFSYSRGPIKLFQFTLFIEIGQNRPDLVRVTRNSRIYRIDQRFVRVENEEEPTHYDLSVHDRHHQARPAGQRRVNVGRVRGNAARGRGRGRANGVRGCGRGNANHQYPLIDLTTRVPLPKALEAEVKVERSSFRRITLEQLNAAFVSADDERMHMHVPVAGTCRQMHAINEAANAITANYVASQSAMSLSTQKVANNIMDGIEEDENFSTDQNIFENQQNMDEVDVVTIDEAVVNENEKVANSNELRSETDGQDIVDSKNGQAVHSQPPTSNEERADSYGNQAMSSTAFASYVAPSFSLSNASSTPPIMSPKTLVVMNKIMNDIEGELNEADSGMFGHSNNPVHIPQEVDSHGHEAIATPNEPHAETDNNEPTNGLAKNGTASKSATSNEEHIANPAPRENRVMSSTALASDTAPFDSISLSDVSSDEDDNMGV